MKAIKFLFIIITVLMSFISCTENDSEVAGPIPADSLDVPLSDDQAAFLETLKDTVIQLENIFFEDGQNVRSFLESNDPEFLEAYPSGRTGETAPRTPWEQKLKFLARMYAMGNYLVDDDHHTYPSAGANSPAQTGLAYSWGSKDYNIRQIPPTASGCMSLKIYGLDCTGMLWAMTQAANLTVVPKYNFFVEYISSAQKWTNAFKASGVYKDLEMKDMGQLTQNKMKNGDIILWRSHIGVYLYGSIYQSNGTPNAPGCANNLQPNRGPRLIPLAAVLAFGLGSYKVFRITHEHNFTLHLAHIANEPCAYIGQHYEDEADMDIKVKDDEVTISNIMNYQSTIHPATISIPGDCSVTCMPGPTGEIDIASGLGETYDDPFSKKKMFTVYLTSPNATTPHITLDCSSGLHIENPSMSYVTEEVWTFVLEDSTQNLGGESMYGIFAKLTPK